MNVLSVVWRHLGGVRWLIIWLVSPKYVVGVNAVIVNDDGHVYLQKHRFWQEQAWGLPGGLIEANESPEEGLKREIGEEMGVGCQVGRLLYSSLFFRRGINLTYAVRLDSEELRLDEAEIIKADYFLATDLPRPIMSTQARLLRQLQEAGTLTEIMRNTV